MIGGAAVLDLGLTPLNLWFLVYDSGFGRLHFIDEMLMTPPLASPKIECCYSVTSASGLSISLFPRVCLSDRLVEKVVHLL